MFFHSKEERKYPGLVNQGVVVTVVVCGTHQRQKSSKMSVIIYCSHVLLGAVTLVNKLLDLSLLLVLIVSLKGDWQPKG